MLSCYFYPYHEVFFVALVVLRATNYGFNHPTREVLYIPTTKEVKFKSKAWTDAFGTRLAKGSGSFFNKISNAMSPSRALLSSSVLTVGIGSVWFVVVYFLGKSLVHAITNKQVIGQEKTNIADSATTETPS